MIDTQGVKLTFNKASLSAFSDGELKIIYLFAAICNRMQLHQTRAFGYWATARDESRSQHARDAAMCGIVESLITLAADDSMVQGGPEEVNEDDPRLVAVRERMRDRLRALLAWARENGRL